MFNKQPPIFVFNILIVTLCNIYRFSDNQNYKSKGKNLTLQLQAIFDI